LSIDARGIDPVPAGDARPRRARDHDVAGTQLGDEHPPLDIDLKGVAVDRTTEHEGCHHAAPRQARDDGGGCPVAVGNAHAPALAARAAPVGAGHVRLGPRLLDEHQALGVEVDLTIEPRPPLPQDVGAVLLDGMAGLFCA
jgi:hypothetical protein